MSGCDMAGFAVNSWAAARNYTRQVAQEVNCTIETSQAMIDCLREADAQDLVDAGFIRGHVRVRGGPYVGGGAMVFLHDQTFFDSQLKRTIIFSDLIKRQQFFISGRTQNMFFTIYFI